jgi:hypothetical protein
MPNGEKNEDRRESPPPIYFSNSYFGKKDKIQPKNGQTEMAPQAVSGAVVYRLTVFTLIYP